MTDSWSFTIPRVVQGVNHGYHIVHVAGHCRIAKMVEVEGWQIEISYRTKLARPKDWVAGRRIRITSRIWFARAGRDADGILKFLHDGIAAGLGVNDSAFLPTVELCEVDKVSPRIEVTVSNEPE